MHTLVRTASGALVAAAMMFAVAPDATANPRSRAAEAAASTFRPPESRAKLQTKVAVFTRELLVDPDPQPAPVPAPAAEPEPPPPTPAEIAVATARAQLGKPYRWAGRGPDAFDCSGLTSFVWAAAGVQLPRTSRAQFNALQSVPAADARPGDLVYSPGHIGLYIGDGRMIHSPHSGRNVQVSPIHDGAIGFVRPG